MSTLFSQFCEIILGPSGAHFLNLVDLERAVSKAIFRSFYSSNPSAGITTIRKYSNGNISIPKKIIEFYSGLSGLKRNVRDLKHLTNQCASIDRLARAQAAVYAWSKTINIPSEYELIVNTFYFHGTDNRELIALFLAAVLHIIIEMSN